ncbi:hypothetical protein EVAR_29820_1 [Eumeta japonica]|uniref:Uncharacterized protein n=1 Tax=Eumeta variegata TaxID=151549 RepID=A0A4C1VU36_EUMVA|nr:hypothetical protein EVAR_29820_1 [Eumeta japonica]
MVPLSKRLSGVILPHEHFGSHIDNKGITSDTQYLWQVIKCADESCYSRSRSALKSVFLDAFLSPPFPILQTPSKLVVSKYVQPMGATSDSIRVNKCTVVTYMTILPKTIVKVEYENSDPEGQMSFSELCASMKRCLSMPSGWTKSKLMQVV